MTDRFSARLRAALLAGAALCSSAAYAAEPQIVQPGAPGQASKVLTPADAIKLADVRYSPGDVAYMQHMIVHHRQATEMTALVEARTTNPDIRRIARRIEASQADEMKFMTDWLTSRGEPLAMPGMGKDGAMNHSGMDHSAMGHSAPSAGKGMVVMEGMATPAQMAALAAAEGTAFDRMFLQLMIAHHRGALDMVEALLAHPDTAEDPMLSDFASSVVADQSAEILRMQSILSELQIQSSEGRP